MWGSLAERIAENVKDSVGQRPEGLMARLGEVVAPALNDDDDDASYESYYETDEEDDDDEEEYSTLERELPAPTTSGFGSLLASAMDQETDDAPITHVQNRQQQQQQAHHGTNHFLTALHLGDSSDNADDEEEIQVQDMTMLSPSLSNNNNTHRHPPPAPLFPEDNDHMQSNTGDISALSPFQSSMVDGNNSIPTMSSITNELTDQNNAPQGVRSRANDNGIAPMAVPTNVLQEAPPQEIPLKQSVESSFSHMDAKENHEERPPVTAAVATTLVPPPPREETPPEPEWKKDINSERNNDNGEGKISPWKDMELTDERVNGSSDPPILKQIALPLMKDISVSLPPHHKRPDETIIPSILPIAHSTIEKEAPLVILEESAASATPLPLPLPPRKLQSEPVLIKEDFVDKEVSSSTIDDVKEADTSSEVQAKAEALEEMCQELTGKLVVAEETIRQLQREATERDQQEEVRQEQQAQSNQNQEQQQSMLQTNQTMERELAVIRRQMEARCTDLEQELDEERAAAAKRQDRLRQLLEEANEKSTAAEVAFQAEASRQEAAKLQLQQRQAKVLRESQERAAIATARLQDKETEVEDLQHVIAELKAHVAEDMEGVEEAEDELREVHTENEALRARIEVLEKERTKMEKKISKLSGDHDKLGGLHMELQMLKEARDRDRAQIESTTSSASEHQTKITSERDAARAEAQDMERQLAAILADLELARADYNRAMLSSANLQRALEAFQNEREAETALLEEQARSSKDATAAAHAATLSATVEANEAQMKAVQHAADAAIRNIMDEVKTLEQTVQSCEKENLYLRRSLDEAIHRLQSNQEDVIDRSIMKNILLDWHAKSGKNRREVLHIMASLLHFTEEEKDKVGVGDNPHTGPIGKVVGAVTAPLPHSDLHLEGDTVREKWVSFLLSEAGEEIGDSQSTNKNAEVSK